MKFYFDISFLISLEKYGELDEWILDDFKYFIEKSLKDEECFIIGNEILSHNYFFESIFFRLLNENTKSLKFLNKNLFEIKLNDNKNTCFKYIFLNEVDSVKNIRENFGYYAYSSDELNSIWIKFHSRRSNEDLKRFINSNESHYHLSTWEDLREFSLPINTFVIADQYLFEYLDSFRFNFSGILKNLGIKPLNKRQIDLVIITSDKIFNSEKNKNDASKIISFIKSNLTKPIDGGLKFNADMINDCLFEIAFQEAKNEIQKLLGDYKFNLTLIRLDDKSTPKSNKAHFRFCLTNTSFINCGHSFTLFGKYGKVRKEDYIFLNSFLWSGNRHVANIGALKVTREALIKIDNITKVWDDVRNLFFYPKRVLVHNHKVNAECLEVYSD